MTQDLNKFKKILNTLLWSSLIYNTSARNERQECDTSDTTATQVRHDWYERNTRPTRMLHEQHEYNTIATRTIRVRHKWEILILITTRVKTYFYTPILTIWQVKDYNERNNFILRTNFFGNALFPCQKCVWKVHHKNWIF